MFKNIEKLIYECREIHDKHITTLTGEEMDILNYFDLYLAKAIMKDLQYGDKGVKAAKIILAMQGLSNESQDEYLNKF